MAIPLILADQKRIHDDEGQSTQLIFAAIGTAQAVPMRPEAGRALRSCTAWICHEFHTSFTPATVVMPWRGRWSLPCGNRCPLNVECHHD